MGPVDMTPMEAWWPVFPLGQPETAAPRGCDREPGLLAPSRWWEGAALHVELQRGERWTQMCPPSGPFAVTRR